MSAESARNQDTEPSRGSKTICIPFESEEHYRRCLEEPSACREHIESIAQRHLELFPPGFEQGFIFKGTYHSKKQDIDLRRLKLEANGDTFQLRPSFLMPYMIGRTEELDGALYLRQWGVPCDALAYVFGKDSSFWYRASLSLGRPSIVGSTVKSKDKLPQHIVADEKHTRLKGEKVYVPTTVADGCILGASVVSSPSTDDLAAGYGDFADEARKIEPTYSPETVCADGWEATWNAWWRLFPAITVLLCYLHSAIKIRDCRGSDHALRFETLTKVWEAFRAETKRSFSQRIRRLRQWVSANLPGGRLREAVVKLCGKREFFAMAYDFVRPYRTSNAVDRLMNHQDRLLYAMRYFHGDLASARLAVRAMAMLWNFHPYGARLRRRDDERLSPFADLNGFVYHDNWLHNFLIASSLGGHRRSS
jgi:hypothetical protein